MILILSCSSSVNSLMFRLTRTNTSCIEDSITSTGCINNYKRSIHTLLFRLSLKKKI
jgi:hypothetical protein